MLSFNFNPRSDWHDFTLVTHWWLQLLAEFSLQVPTMRPKLSGSIMFKAFWAFSGFSGQGACGPCGGTTWSWKTWNSSTVDWKDKASSASTVVKFRHVEFLLDAECGRSFQAMSFQPFSGSIIKARNFESAEPLTVNGLLVARIRPSHEISLPGSGIYYQTQTISTISDLWDLLVLFWYWHLVSVSSALLLRCFKSKSAKVGKNHMPCYGNNMGRATTSGATFDSLGRCHSCITEPLEVIMFFGCFARYPSFRPILKKFGHQIHALRFQSRCYWSPGLGFKHWKVWLPVWQFGDGWPSLCWRSPQDPKDLLELIGISVSRKQRTASHNLCKDTPNWPNVYWGGVLARTHQHIWGSIPQGDHLMGVAPHRDTESPG